MRNSNTIIVGILALVLGFIGGLFWSAQNETPQQTFTQAQRPVAGQSSELSTEDRNLLRRLQEDVERDRTNFQALVKLANFYFDRESYNQAVTYYEKAMAVNPNDPNVITDLGIMYRRLGNPEKAVSLFQQAAKVDPAHENAMLNLGIVYFHDLNDKASALKAWEDYLSLGVKGERVDQIRRTVEQLRKSLGTAAP